MKKLTADAYRRMPWKNGAGTTAEIAIYPAQSSISDSNFIWRVSIAEIAADAPFSPLPGYDRLIMLLDGQGMTLDSGKLGEIALDMPLVPLAIPGELPVTARLRAGICHDFNVMTARLKARSRLSVHRLDGAGLTVSGDSDAFIAYVIDGRLSADGKAAEPGDTLLREQRSPGPLTLEGTATVALVEIVLVQPR